MSQKADLQSLSKEEAQLSNGVISWAPEPHRLSASTILDAAAHSMALTVWHSQYDAPSMVLTVWCSQYGAPSMASSPSCPPTQMEGKKQHSLPQGWDYLISPSPGLAHGAITASPALFNLSLPPFIPLAQRLLPRSSSFPSTQHSGRPPYPSSLSPCFPRDQVLRILAKNEKQLSLLRDLEGLKPQKVRLAPGPQRPHLSSLFCPLTPSNPKLFFLRSPTLRIWATPM